jgi:predicted  nucleic acid-binding Zn-ribbon protein
MTLLGKVFTLLILLLSVAFFIISLLANSTHIDHKKRVSQYQTQAKQLETTVDELKKLVEQLQTSRAQEQASRRTALAALQTQLESAKEQLAQANLELNSKAATLTENTQKMGETLDRVKLLTSQNDALKTEIDKIISDRADKTRRVINLTDKLNGMESQSADLKAQVAQLQVDLTTYQAKAETASAALLAAGIRDPEDVPPSDLKGEVLSVGSNQSVVVSVGKDDGLREGHYLEIFRSGQYLGRIQIRKVEDDKAIGQILASFRKGYIQAGDKVASKVN